MDHAPRASEFTLPEAARRTSVDRWQDSLDARLRIPEPQFSTTTPAGRRSSCPMIASAPGGQPDPTSDVV